LSTIVKWQSTIDKWLSSEVKVSWARRHTEWKRGARDDQHGVGQRSIRRMKARRMWARWSVRGKRARGLEGRTRRSDGRTPDSVGDRLPGPGDAPMVHHLRWCISFIYIYIYIYTRGGRIHSLPRSLKDYSSLLLRSTKSPQTTCDVAY
jgi:hypothetical protein